MSEYIFNVGSFRLGEGRDAIYVEDRGNALWAVTRGGNSSFNIHGEWEAEALPSNRDAAFLKRCRYSLGIAFEQAKVAYRLQEGKTYE